MSASDKALVNALVESWANGFRADVIAEGVVGDHFTSTKGGLKCKTCGEVVPHPRAAAAHFASKHKK